MCGTILDFEESTSPPSSIQVHGREYKLDLLCESLQAVQRRVDALHTRAKYALALEMEPGETYVLNSLQKMLSLAARLDGSHAPSGSRFMGLKSCVGFNLDIAHMKIEGISAASLRPLLSRICHSHISDHPGMHTHDQFVGSWTSVERYGVDQGYYPYIRLLMERRTGAGELPFSGAIAVELEGCNRIFAIHDSLSRLKHMIESTARRR